MGVNINDQNDTIKTGSSILRQSDTGGFIVASGDNVATKPTPIGNNGLIRYNTTNNALEAVINGAYHTFAFLDTISGFVQKAGDTMTGALGIIPGTTTAPGLFISGSTTTGIYSPGANVIGITTNGTAALLVDNAQNITASGTNISLFPAAGSATIFAQGNGQSSSFGKLVLSSSNGSASVGTANTQPLTFLINNSEVARISSVGQLLLGTITPAGSGNIETIAGTSVGDTLVVKQASSANYLTFQPETALNTANIGYSLAGTSWGNLNLNNLSGSVKAITPTAGDNSNNVATTAFVTNAIAAAPKGNQGSYKNLRVTNSTGSPNSVMTLTADAVILSSGTSQVQISNVSLNPSLAVSGVNGLDTGTVSANQWYYIYVIYNPTSLTTAALFSLSSTSPTLPSGYTFYAMLGVARTNSSVVLVGSIQYGNDWQYKVGTNLTAPPLIQTGYLSVPTATSISSVTPTPVAARIKIMLVCQANSFDQASVSPNANWGYNGSGIGYLQPPYADSGNIGFNVTNVEFLLESTNVYIWNANGGHYFYCSGFTINF